MRTSISNESIRRRVPKFGHVIAKNLRKTRPKAYTRWHLDEMMKWWTGSLESKCTCGALSTAKVRSLKFSFSPSATRPAALRLLRELLRRQGFVPTVVVPDKLRSYGSALHEIGFSVRAGKDYAPTTARRTRINRFDDVNERCKASNQ
jgi:putative transposase